MAGDSTHPLSVEEAKQALRNRARRAGFKSVLLEHPVRGLVLAFCSGMLAGNKKSQRLAASVLSPVLLRALVPRRYGNDRDKAEYYETRQ